MSKSKGNVVDPWHHFNKEGADSSRWYMVTAGAPWNPLKFDPDGVRETYAKYFLTLWNVYKFHADYAALDNFDPEINSFPIEKRSELDRWILSRVTSVAKKYHYQFKNWDFHKACRDLENFVINDLSNWYVRRSRRRLWDDSTSDDKKSCQHTLHEILTIVCKLTAPVAPFMADEIYSNLTGSSVHLADWPTEENGALPRQDLDLEAKMGLVRSLAETGRRIRVKEKRRQRLPCNNGWIVGGPELNQFHEILAEELNVENISTVGDLDKFQKIELSPNRKMLGKKCRQDLPSVLEAISSADPDLTWSEIKAGKCTLAGYKITEEDIELRRVERSGFAAETIIFSENEQDIDVSLVLDMQITPELASKGLARDIIRRIQQKRKDLALDIEEDIELTVWLGEGNPELLSNDWEHLKNETRAANASLKLGKGADDSETFEVDDCLIYFKVN